MSCSSPGWALCVSMCMAAVVSIPHPHKHIRPPPPAHRWSTPEPSAGSWEMWTARSLCPCGSRSRWTSQPCMLLARVCVGLGCPCHAPRPVHVVLRGVVRGGFLPCQQTADKLFMVTDYCRGGELFFHLKKYVDGCAREHGACSLCLCTDVLAASCVRCPACVGCPPGSGRSRSQWCSSLLRSWWRP